MFFTFARFLITVVSRGMSMSSSSATVSHFERFLELGVDGPASVDMVGGRQSRETVKQRTIDAFGRKGFGA
jgi:hypothetical protein